MRKLIYCALAIVCIALGCSGPMFAANKPTHSFKSHAAVKVAIVASKVVTKAPTGLAKIGGSILFGVEVPVDGAHAGFSFADKAFDFLSLQGKVPVLDVIYVGVSVGNKDTAALDGGLESLQTRFFGYHN